MDKASFLSIRRLKMLGREETQQQQQIQESSSQASLNNWAEIPSGAGPG
jgi:hypothetical protein